MPVPPCKCSKQQSDNLPGNLFKACVALAGDGADEHSSQQEDADFCCIHPAILSSNVAKPFTTCNSGFHECISIVFGLQDDAGCQDVCALPCRAHLLSFAKFLKVHACRSLLLYARLGKVHSN